MVSAGIRVGVVARAWCRGAKLVSTETVRAELARILKSPRFDASERNRGFLTHVVEEALAGRTDRIKAYTIATEVFGRDAKFDPQLDSIVRVEAGRLRRSLERYYLTDGRASESAHRHPAGRRGAGLRRAALDRDAATGGRPPRPGVLVTAFEEEGDHAGPSRPSPAASPARWSSR